MFRLCCFLKYTFIKSKEEIDEYRKLAEKMIEENRENEFMPPKAYLGTLISPKTFLECSKEGSPIDVFPYRDEKNPFTCFSKISTPIFICFGTGGDYLLQSFEYTKKLLCSKKDKHAEVSFNLIEGASHNYRGFEQELSEKIVEWLYNVIKKDNSYRLCDN